MTANIQAGELFDGCVFRQTRVSEQCMSVRTDRLRAVHYTANYTMYCGRYRTEWTLLRRCSLLISHTGLGRTYSYR